MILIYCGHCFTGVRVIGNPHEIESLIGERSDFWPNKHLCVACNGHAGYAHETDVDPSVIRRLKMRNLTPAEMVAALHGFGTPDEMVCDLITVRELFHNKQVKTVFGANTSGNKRAVIEHIEFDDGTRLFIGASSAGAVVYRIARPFSYAENIDG